MDNTYTARPVCWSGWISDSYCSLKPLCSGMGEVVAARTSPTLLPPSPHTVLSLSCFSKCHSASIVVTGTVRDKIKIEVRGHLDIFTCRWSDCRREIRILTICASITKPPKWMLAQYSNGTNYAACFIIRLLTTFIPFLRYVCLFVCPYVLCVTPPNRPDLCFFKV